MTDVWWLTYPDVSTMPGCIQLLADSPWFAPSGSSLRAVTGPLTWARLGTASCNPNMVTCSSCVSWQCVSCLPPDLYFSDLSPDNGEWVSWRHSRHWAVLSQCIYCKREAVKVLSLNSNCSDLAGVWQSPTGRGRWVCSCVASSVPVWVLKLDPRALTTSHTGPPVPACPREAANTRHSQHQKYQTQGGQVTLGSLSRRSSWGQEWPRLSFASQFWNNYFLLFAGHPAAPECPRAPSLYLGQLGVSRVSRVRGPK